MCSSELAPSAIFLESGTKSNYLPFLNCLSDFGGKQTTGVRIVENISNLIPEQHRRRMLRTGIFDIIPIGQTIDWIENVHGKIDPQSQQDDL